MFYKALMVLLTVISIGFPQEKPKLGSFRINNEPLEWTHDKEAHVAGSFGLYYLFRYKEFSELNSIGITITFGLLKESVDALVPWEKYENWGGDGWSNADLKANLIGIGSAYLVDKLWEKESYEKTSTHITIYPGYIRVNLYFN